MQGNVAQPNKSHLTKTNNKLVFEVEMLHV